MFEGVLWGVSGYFGAFQGILRSHQTGEGCRV